MNISTGTVIDRSTRPAAWIATAVTAPAHGGPGVRPPAAPAAARAPRPRRRPSAPAGPTVVTSAVPDLDQATEAVCDPVLAALPVRSTAATGEPTPVRRRVTPGGPSILAWASPVVTLQCGVFRPADLRSDVQYQPILLGGLGKPQVAWLAEQQGDRVVCTTIDRSVYLAVTVPAGDTSYAADRLRRHRDQAARRVHRARRAGTSPTPPPPDCERPALRRGRQPRGRGAGAGGDQAVESSGSRTPLAAHICGIHRDRREAGQRVDLVDHDRPVGGEEEVDPRQARAVQRPERRRRRSPASRAVTSAGEVRRGRRTRQASSRYLASKSYQSWPGRQPDLGRHDWPTRRPVGVLEHAALDLAAGLRRLDQHLASRARSAVSSAAGSSSQAVTG